jgi:alkylhydroperoxidase/carboxymuconolactone decarboxylase family protein YurZ
MAASGSDRQPRTQKDETVGYEGKMVLEYLSRAHDTSLFTEREKQFVGLAVTMTRGCQVCTRGRIEKARAAGISDDVLNALVEIVSAVNAGVTAATAREGFRQADAANSDACGSLCAAEGIKG